jgi:hypothetical protein
MSEQNEQQQQPAAPAPAPAVDATEARRVAIMNEPDYWQDGPKTKALREEMQRIVDPERAAAKAAAPTPKQDEPQLTPSQQRAEDRLRAMKSDPNYWKKGPEHDKLMAEQRKLLAELETIEEKDRRAEQAVSDRRREYGVDVPSKIPKTWAKEYEADWSQHEAPLFDLAHEHGLDGGQVRDLRDAAIELGQVVGDRGKPATDDEVKQVFERLRIPASSRAALMKLWRQIEGAPQQ